MDLARRLLPALIAMVALSAAGASGAAETEAVATAPPSTTGAPPTAPSATPSATAAPSVADQIDTYLKTSPAIALPKDNASGVTSGDEPRQMHSIVDIAAGSNGYRSAFVASEMPIGKTSTLTVAVGQTQFKGRLGNRFETDGRQSLGLGFDLGGYSDPTSLRCRPAAADNAVNLDPRFGGGRTCHAPDAPPPPQ